MTDPLLTITDVAEHLGLTISQTRRLEKAGDLRSVNIAPSGSKRRTLRFRRADVDAYVESRTSSHQSLAPNRRSRSIQQRLAAAEAAR